MAEKQLIVVVEATMAMGPDWPTVLSYYVVKIIRSLLGNELSGQKPSTPTVEMSLVTFYSHGSYSGCLVRRSGWTRDIELFVKWLSAIPFASGDFGEAAIAEGLSEALMMFSTTQNGSQNQQNVDFQKHCILVAASNPYPLPTPVYRPQMQNVELSGSCVAQTESCLYDAEAVAKAFAQCYVSLSVICTKQLPKLKAIYNAGKGNSQSGDPPIDFLVLISENFIEAHATLSHPGSFFSGTGSVISTPKISQQAQSGLQTLGANSSSVSNPFSQQASSAQSAHSKYVKVWEGNLALCALNQGHPMFITRLEGYRSASSSETLAANWPPTLQIGWLYSQDYINDKPYVKLADFIVFQAMDQHDFLRQMQENKLMALIKLPSQSLLLSVSDKDRQLNGLLLPWDMVKLRPGQQLMPPELTKTATSPSTNAAAATAATIGAAIATTATAATTATTATAATTATTATAATTATTSRRSTRLKSRNQGGTA